MPANVSWVRKFRETGDVAVIHVDLTPQEDRERHALSWLDDDEQVRWHRYRYDRPRREFALCRSALRSILCRRLDCKNAQLSFGTARHGKPFARIGGVPASISFNVSHSGKHGLVGIAPQGRLGVDVEERIPRIDLEGIGKMVFGPYEQRDLTLMGGSEKNHFFFALWTLKEALIKALGTGFSLDPSRFEIPSTMRRGARNSLFRFPHLPNVTWKLENLGNTDFAATIAHELDPAPGQRVIEEA
ncbi:MAG: 4'-phosphopantetheinyl transferase superfamily protein [Gammaproteobacteria bacterium]|nr:4'-phosphopantetheinyl transferase superfamily protein [Gammaproteobacteria bacterium]